MILGVGILDMWGLGRSSTSQSWHISTSFDKSVIISDMGHHRLGQVPPKVNLKDMRPTSSMIVEHAAAEWPHMVIRLYAALKSYFPIRIGMLG